MESRHYLAVGATLVILYVATISGQNTQVVRIPRTRFTCTGKPSGYYADLETGCQVYHMCDGLGRQFSYTCPNTTLFQQRMLVCDHWYMVNCAKSEADYGANLLIGQRDKPFVSDAEMRDRTPRPDILSVPFNNNYYDGLKEAETKFPVHPSNSIVGSADSISSGNNNGLDSAKEQYRPPTSWSTGTGRKPIRNPTYDNNEDDITGAASHRPTPTIHTTHEGKTQTLRPISKVPTPSNDLVPPFSPTTESGSDEYDIDIRMKDKVVNFINRFDPNSPDRTNTAMTASEIHSINQQLPQGPDASSEEERQPRKQKNKENNLNVLDNEKRKGVTIQSRFDSVNSKPATVTVPDFTVPTTERNGIPTPSRDLLPPKEELLNLPSTTVGPPIYYQWKWAVPALDLEPPRQTNKTEDAIETESQARNVIGKSEWTGVTRPTPREVGVTVPNTEYNISSYLVPDYVFPLDKPHPSYNREDAQTSFQVEVSRPGRSSYGENPNCPQCHPAHLKPGTCEPCIVKR